MGNTESEPPTLEDRWVAFAASYRQYVLALWVGMRAGEDTDVRTDLLRKASRLGRSLPVAGGQTMNENFRDHADLIADYAVAQLGFKDTAVARETLLSSDTTHMCRNLCMAVRFRSRTCGTPRYREGFEEAWGAYTGALLAMVISLAEDLRTGGTSPAPERGQELTDFEDRTRELAQCVEKVVEKM